MNATVSYHRTSTLKLHSASPTNQIYAFMTGYNWEVAGVHNNWSRLCRWANERIKLGSTHIISTQKPISQSHTPPPLTIKRWAVLKPGAISFKVIRVVNHLSALPVMLQYYQSSQMASTGL